MKTSKTYAAFVFKKTESDGSVKLRGYYAVFDGGVNLLPALKKAESYKDAESPCVFAGFDFYYAGLFTSKTEAAGFLESLTGLPAAAL